MLGHFFFSDECAARSVNDVSFISFYQSRIEAAYVRQKIALAIGVIVLEKHNPTLGHFCSKLVRPFCYMFSNVF